MSGIQHSFVIIIPVNKILEFYSEKESFTERSKILAEYRSKNNFVGILKMMSNVTKILIF